MSIDLSHNDKSIISSETNMENRIGGQFSVDQDKRIMIEIERNSSENSTEEKINSKSDSDSDDGSSKMKNLFKKSVAQKINEIRAKKKEVLVKEEEDICQFLHMKNDELQDGMVLLKRKTQRILETIISKCFDQEQEIQELKAVLCKQKLKLEKKDLISQCLESTMKNDIKYLMETNEALSKRQELLEEKQKNTEKLMEGDFEDESTKTMDKILERLSNAELRIDMANTRITNCNSIIDSQRRPSKGENVLTEFNENMRKSIEQINSDIKKLQKDNISNIPTITEIEKIVLSEVKLSEDCILRETNKRIQNLHNEYVDQNMQDFNFLKESIYDVVLTESKKFDEKCEKLKELANGLLEDNTSESFDILKRKFHSIELKYDSLKDDVKVTEARVDDMENSILQKFQRYEDLSQKPSLVRPSECRNISIPCIKINENEEGLKKLHQDILDLKKYVDNRTNEYSTRIEENNAANNQKLSKKEFIESFYPNFAKINEIDRAHALYRRLNEEFLIMDKRMEKIEREALKRALNQKKNLITTEPNGNSSNKLEVAETYISGNEKNTSNLPAAGKLYFKCLVCNDSSDITISRNEYSPFKLQSKSYNSIWSKNQKGHSGKKSQGESRYPTPPSRLDNVEIHSGNKKRTLAILEELGN